jgi:phage shock protein A
MTQLELRRHARELADAHKAREATKDELDHAQAEIANLRRKLEALQAGRDGEPARGKLSKRRKGK